MRGDRRDTRIVRREQDTHHVQSGRNVPRSHDPPRRGSVTAENTERNRAEYFARGTDDHFFAGGRHATAFRDLFPSSAEQFRARIATCVPDPHDHRPTALPHRHFWYGPHYPEQHHFDILPRAWSTRRRGPP